jgi:hypothetical protein
MNVLPLHVGVMMGVFGRRESSESGPTRARTIDKMLYKTIVDYCFSLLRFEPAWFEFVRGAIFFAPLTTLGVFHAI